MVHTLTRGNQPIEVYIRTRGRTTGDAACTNVTGLQNDKRAILYARWIWNTRLSFFIFYKVAHTAVCSTYKMAAQTLAVRWLFCQVRKWPPACMPGCVYRPVRPLVLIYNSMNQPYCMHKEHLGSTRDILLAVIYYPQENNENTEMWMNSLIRDCLELVVCKLTCVTWP